MKKLLVPFITAILPAFVLMLSVQTSHPASATWSSARWPENPATSLSDASSMPAKSQHLDADGARRFAKLSPKLARVSQPRQLSLADRVAYQRAIEEVYWRHRIWPTERPDPKPSLEQVMSRAQLAQKVEDYLRNSQALEDYWQQPVSAEQLQVEMERMAQHTRQPEVLHELFNALGNDPFVIAECLARPTLSQRLVTNRLKLPAIESRQEPFEAWRARAENQMPKVMAAPAADYALPTISETVNGFTGDNLTATSTTNAPTTGCTDDTWAATSTTNAPTARFNHTAVWTGSEMIVWGGGDANNNYLNTGGRYNPSTDSWTATSTINAPTARESHTAVWSGSQMIVWGGFDGGNANTGGRYNPGTDSWTATSTANAPTARDSHTAVWSGSEMIVWGGFDTNVYVNTGGRYNPGTNSWTATSATNAPTHRDTHTAVWTGSEMIVWGGLDLSNLFNTGGRYCAQTQTPMVQSAFSRKTHGAAGTFDIPLPLTGTDGVECRTTGGTNDYAIVVTFSSNVTVTGNPQAQLTMGTGCVGSAGVCTGNVTVSGNIVTVALTNIANAQNINVRINGVNSAGANVPAIDFNIPMGVLIGDTNGSRSVSAADIGQTKAQSGQTTNGSNFRTDVNANGSIGASDIGLVKSKSGHSLPP